MLIPEITLPAPSDQQPTNKNSASASHLYDQQCVLRPFLNEQKCSPLVIPAFAFRDSFFKEAWGASLVAALCLSLLLMRDPGVTVIEIEGRVSCIFASLASLGDLRRGLTKAARFGVFTSTLLPGREPGPMGCFLEKWSTHVFSWLDVLS